VQPDRHNIFMAFISTFSEENNTRRLSCSLRYAVT
jgi:hypothetical protein